jgi:beta-N-acetylhexosaminidase
MGPLWIDVEGYELSSEDREILEHPTVGGLILFTRNFYDTAQLQALTKDIRKAAKRPILIGVDQEGGRVQRFRDTFSLIPAAQEYAKHKNGEELANLGGWLMAAELIAHDIDLSFAPVLDMGHQCKAIGTRSFGEDKTTILKYSGAYIQGMKSAGMSVTGKHFPGHGGVIADSHLETPYDQRSNIFEEDMVIFQAQIDADALDAMMPAHVVFPHYDEHPASGSEFWLKTILRQKLGFKGVIFSDDLTMEGAAIMGTPCQRAIQALNAGCDMLLVCNHRGAQIEVLDGLAVQESPLASTLKKAQNICLKELQGSQRWKDARRKLEKICY